ncbi:hypothetical protein JAO73_10545 [Hymenobacter sp. BT523]|uniref:hypothetical protein n=1 Tax=Hymenobacter sp. BT523 TaxID=2795725 RepID=UPI0018EAABA2|nr:hypothetical protein [Hymenobacter sp. BT523]MBJ6109454.1 hypothetical protein [Hymenobacter sp. BT523]
MAQTTPLSTGASTAQVLDLHQAPLTQVVGYTQVYYHWADGLRPFAVAGGRVVGNLESRPGFAWQLLPLTAHTIKFTESPKESRHGSLYQAKLQAERPQPAPNVLDGVAALERRPVVLLVRQADGQLRVVGSPEEPLRLLTGSQGQHPGTRAGLDVTLSGLTTGLAPFYAGALPVDGQDAGAVVPTGNIRVLDGQGRLLQVVPLGYDLIIEGPFRTDVRLQRA